MNEVNLFCIAALYYSFFEVSARAGAIGEIMGIWFTSFTSFTFKHGRFSAPAAQPGTPSAGNVAGRGTTETKRGGGARGKK